MAEKIIRQLIDDIDGVEIPDGGGERIEFSLRGVDYQIDLSAGNVAKLEKVFKPYIDAAVTVRGGSKGRRTRANRNGKASSEQLATIREWARNNGHEVADRGRIKTDIVEAFEAAH